MSWPRFASRLMHGPAFRCVAGRSSKYADRPWFPEGRDLGQYGFVFLQAGSGRYWDDRGRQEAVRAGKLLTLFPGLRHHYSPGPGEYWQEWFIDIDAPLMAACEAQGLISREEPVLEPAAAVHGPLLQLITDIADGRLSDPRLCALRLHGALVTLAEDRDRMDEPVRRARRQLQVRPPDCPLDLHDLAARCGIGYESLRKRFKRTVGMSLQRYRLQVRCLKAAELLLDGVPVDDVAERIGFCDVAHLSRHFRRVFACTPAAYRRLHGHAGGDPDGQVTPGNR